MPKKMHDILSPKAAHKVENTVKSLGVNHKKAFRQPKRTSERNKTPFPVKKGLLAGGVVLVLVLCGVAFVKLPKADIEIWPSMETLTLNEKVTINKSATASDVATNVIPATYIEVVQDGKQEFPATGMASNDGKAGGNITIYNKLDSSFALLKGTHFLSDSGKYFVTDEKLTVPAAKTQGGKLVAGSVVTRALAQDVGEDYNIGPSKFSIPKLNGTPYYYSIYAESTAAMTGGHTGSVKKVTNDDILQAKDILTKKALQDGQDALKAKLGADEILLDGAIESGAIDAVCDVSPETIADTFTETVKVKVSGLAFKKQDLENVIKDKMALELSAEKDILQSSLALTYSPSSLLDIKKGTLTLKVDASAKTYQSVDPSKFTDVLVNKTSAQIESTVNQIYDNNISKIKVKLWPFWVTKTPSDKSRIKTNLNFE